MTAKGVASRRVLRLGPGGAEGDDEVLVEEPLEIRVSGEPLAVTMRTPGEDQKLALGFLLSEGLIRSAGDVSAIAHCGRPGEEGYGNVLEVTPAPGADIDAEALSLRRRGTLTTAACGVCGRRSIDELLALCGELPPGPEVPAALLFASTARLPAEQAKFKRTGGAHAALALDARGEALFAFEDVGRHNAVDKVVGALVAAGRLGAAAILAVSGRASFEIVQKAAVARIPIVASVSAASSLAIDLARRVNLTLAAFVRGDSLNLYSGPERVAGLGEAP
jgi:FdhD protein